MNIDATQNLLDSKIFYLYLTSGILSNNPKLFIQNLFTILK